MDCLQTQSQENLWIPSEVNFPSCTVFSSLLSLAPKFAVHAVPSENHSVHVLSRTIFSGAPSSHVTLEHWFSITPPLFHQEYWRCRLKKGLSIHFIPLRSHSHATVSDAQRMLRKYISFHSAPLLWTITRCPWVKVWSMNKRWKQWSTS